MDLLAPIRAELDSIRKDVERTVKIALLREGVETALARLKDLDSSRALKYHAALMALQD